MMSPHLEERHRSVWRDAVVSVLLYLLALEWFRPLLDISGSLHMAMPFYIAFAVFLLPEVLGLPPLVGWLVRIAAAYVIVGVLFTTPGQGLGWVAEYAAITVDDARYVLRAEFDQLSMENRSVLFLAGWMMLLTSIQSMLLHRERAVWLVAATAGYMLGLQWWTGLDIGPGLVRACAIGLAMAALLRLPELERRFGSGTPGRAWPAAWLAVAAVFTAATIGAGWGLAQPHQAVPQEQAPLRQPLLARLAELWGGEGAFAVPAAYRGAAAASRTGYGDSDFQLGGPVVPDEGIAFIGRTDKPAYWRGEAKSIYDGKGWIQVEQHALTGMTGEPLASLASQADLPVAAAPERPEITQEVWLKDQRLGRILFSGGDVMKVEVARNDRGDALENAAVRFYPSSGKLQLDSGESPLAYYRLTARPPYDSRRLAASLTQQEPTPAEQGFRNELSLPMGMPERVKELAQDITAGYDAPMLKAQAIEDYLKTHYTYSLDKPGFVEQGQEFVDRFLFVDGAGYCDHFSTAMAVLLRAADIPSRWVKGFAPGDLTASSDPIVQEEIAADTDLGMEAAAYTYIVRNKHAHSWVEAYIAPYGWVPFEPTPGFAGYSEALTGDVTAVTAVSSVTDAVLGVENPANRTAQALLSVEGEAGETTVLVLKRVVEVVRSQWLIMAVLGVCFVIAGIWLAARALVRTRERNDSLPPGLAYSSRLGGRTASSVRTARLMAAMERIWAQLFQRYGIIQHTQTPREYVDCIAEQHHFPVAQRNWASEFVGLYESLRYNADIPHDLSLKRISELRRQLQAFGGP
jgi:transglutaminase-like putative cysteine protease